MDILKIAERKLSTMILILLLAMPCYGAVIQEKLMQVAAEFHTRYPHSEKIAELSILKLPWDCSHKPLQVCHIGHKDIQQYYQYCFANDCEEANYHCLNGDGFTLHICGPIPSCNKRFRNIAVPSSTKNNTVDVYSVPCPECYVQDAHRDCFQLCRKDDSVVIVQKSTPDKLGLAHCNSKEGYCNDKVNGVFELGGEHDQCHIHENNCQELMLPNCSCTTHCLPGQRRSFESNFTCKSISNGSTTGIPQETLQSSSLSTSSSQTVYEVTHTGSEKKHESIDTVLIICVVSIVLSVLIGAGLVVVLCRQREQRQRDETSETQRELDRRENGVQDGLLASGREPDEHTDKANGVRPQQNGHRSNGYIPVLTMENETEIEIDGEEPGNPNESQEMEDDSACDQNVDDQLDTSNRSQHEDIDAQVNEAVPSDSHQNQEQDDNVNIQMENLKSHSVGQINDQSSNFNSEETGYASDSETKVKRLV